MSSIKNRIIIEEYITGGYGIFFTDGRKEIMGLSSWNKVIDQLEKL